MSLRNALKSDELKVGVGVTVIAMSFYYLVFPVMDLVGFRPNLYQVTFYYSMFFLLVVAGVTLVLYGVGDKLNFDLLPVDISNISDHDSEFQFYLSSVLFVVLAKYTYLTYMVGESVLPSVVALLLVSYTLVYYFRRMWSKYRE